MLNSKAGLYRLSNCPWNEHTLGLILSWDAFWMAGPICRWSVKWLDAAFVRDCYKWLGADFYKCFPVDSSRALLPVLHLVVYLSVPCKFHTGMISINSAVYTYTVQARSESGGKLLCEIRLVTRVGLDGDPWPIKNQFPGPDWVLCTCVNTSIWYDTYNVEVPPRFIYMNQYRANPN